MNKEWANDNKTMQKQLNSKQTFSDGIKTLLDLREKIFRELLRLKRELRAEDFYKMPFPTANGYHSKTIAYSLWHIFRIEDIVAHSLIRNDNEIFLKYDYQNRIKASIITTGNELRGQQIEEFSQKLDLEQLYEYAQQVKQSTDDLLSHLTFANMKKKFDCRDKIRLHASNEVSSDENAAWLIDYWCKKDIRGLVKMSFSRHWIMHAEACLRIEERINKQKA